MLKPRLSLLLVVAAAIAAHVTVFALPPQVDTGLGEQGVNFQVEFVDSPNVRSRNENQEEDDGDDNGDDSGDDEDDGDQDDQGEDGDSGEDGDDVSGEGEDKEEEPERRGGPDLLRLMERERNLGTFVSYIRQAKLADLFDEDDDDESGESGRKSKKKDKDTGPFTVFAPTDRAFGKIPFRDRQYILNDPEVLEKLILRHVGRKEVMTDDLPQDGSVLLATKGGEFLSLTTNGKSKVTVTSSVTEAKVTEADQLASNGIVHVVDTVL